jgi:ABC-2 type transport system ATP-binding protein
VSAGAPEPVIDVRDLTKVFQRTRAVDGVSFQVRRGEILGLLGPNGAGKTTTIQLILGLTTPTSGSVRVLGLDVARERRRMLARVNFSSAYVSMPANLTVRENLTVFSKLYGVPNRQRRIADMLDLFGVTDLADRRTGALSSGQATRVNLCKAFLNDPEILFLDEPTASLDPDIADRVRTRLAELRRSRGLSMIYTSHNMREFEILCDRVLFLSKGRIVAQGTPEEISKTAAGGTLEEVFLRIARDGEVWDATAAKAE